MTKELVLDRRAFAAATIGTGFALAVQPVSAETITTDANGLTAGEIKIPVSDGQIPGYRAMPAGKTNLPTILVVQEIFGIHEWIKDICRRFAKLGYLAVAPSLYARVGDATKYTDIKKLVDEIVMKVEDEPVLSDLDATVKWAAGNGGNTDKLGVTGFCWGGRIVWLYTAHNPNIKAGVAWYGGLVGKGDHPRPLQAVTLADKMKGRVLGLYGGLDKGITADDVAQMRAALKAAGDEKSNIIVYPEAEHGFLADYRPSYNEAAAKDGWAKALDWFKSHGVV
jgi:carboxymethylenebutenolidase